MDKRFFTNLNDVVRKAATSKNMSELGHNLDDVVSEVISTVKDVANQANQNISTSYKPPVQAEWKRPQSQEISQIMKPAAYSPQFRIPSRGKAAGITLTTLGCVFTPLSAIVFLILGIIFLAMGSFSALGTTAAVTLPLLALSITFIIAGSKLRARYRRCREYLRLAGTAEFVSVRELAENTRQDPFFVAKDLEKMIRKKMISPAYLDQQKTCLMLDVGTYQQYLAAQKALQERQAEEERIRKECEANPQRAELYRTIQEGKEYIRQIKEANDAIPNEDISNQLFELEDVTTRIFAHVEKRPAKLPEISKFMRYYLPTTLKLVNAYREFESQPVQGENISAAKTEIQGALVTINRAFENLLDSLFENDALDISTDISVLHTMLAQEGLTDSDFSRQSDNNGNTSTK